MGHLQHTQKQPVVTQIRQQAAQAWAAEEGYVSTDTQMLGSSPGTRIWIYVLQP
jgi:hypothetical protein